jgi:hypothetical protein
VPYRTVRAWRSTGAPDRTAAATLSPGSLPSMTRLGTGEKLLQAALATFLSEHVAGDIRCPVINGYVVVGLMPHSLSGVFLANLGRVARELDSWRILGRRLAVGLVGRVCTVSGCQCAHGARPQGWCKHLGCDGPGEGRHGGCSVGGAANVSMSMSRSMMGARIRESWRRPAETRSFLHNLTVDPHLPSIVLPAQVRRPDLSKPQRNSN